MKTSIVILALFGLIDARHHHHHVSFAQGNTNGHVDNSTPKSNRELFDEDVKKAAEVVATEHKSEKTRTSTHKDAMASQYKQTYDKNSATRTKYVNENV